MRDPRLFALLCTLVGGLGQGVVSPQLPEILHGASRLALASGISATLMYLGIFVSTYRFGRLADEGRIHWLLAPGLFLYALTLLAISFAPNETAVYVIRFVEGLALSAIFVATDFVLGRLSPPGERGRWLSYYGVALSIGLLLGPGVALLAAAPGLSLRIVAGVAALLGAAALRVRVARIPAPEGAREPLRFGALAAGATYGFMEAGLVAVFPVLAVLEFHLPPEYCLMAVIVAAALSSVFWGTAADRRGARPVLMLLLALLAAGPLVLCALPGVAGLAPAAVAYASCALFGVLAGGIYPVGFAWLLEQLPESQYGHASGGFARAYGLGSLAGPLAAGIAVQAYGSRGLFLVMAGAGALGLGALRERVRKPF